LEKTQLCLKTGRTTTVKVPSKVRLDEPRKSEWISLDLAELLPKSMKSKILSAFLDGPFKSKNGKFSVDF
jgi:hypothetical protein